MNIKKAVLAGLAGFVGIFLVDFLLHGVLLMGIYRETQSVWRVESDMNAKVWMMTVGQILFGAVLAWVYTKGYEKAKEGLGQGLRFGLYSGLIVAASQNFVWYVVLPIPFVLSLAWTAGVIVKCLFAGTLIGLVYKP